MSRGKLALLALAGLAVAIAAGFAASSGIFRPPGQDSGQATASSPSGSLTIITLLQGKLAPGATYRIYPDPVPSGGNYTVQDGDPDRDTSPGQGIITVRGLADGTYSLIQVSGPQGQEREVAPKVVTIANGSSELATFGGVQQASPTPSTSGLTGVSSVLYAAKFECGTISGSEGPLRPGHYETDVGIFNKQDFEVKFTWMAASNGGAQGTSLLGSLGSQSSTSLVCADIRKMTGMGGNFTEGYVLIQVPVDPRLRALLSGGTIQSTTDDSINFLEVQTFYTANALDVLPHSIVVDKITFVVHTNGTSTSLPQSMLETVLDVTLPSQVGEISNTEQRIRDYLLEKYGLSGSDLASLTVDIKSVSVGVGTMIDDHAVSLSKVMPQPLAG